MKKVIDRRWQVGSGKQSPSIGKTDQEAISVDNGTDALTAENILRLRFI